MASFFQGLPVHLVSHLGQGLLAQLGVDRGHGRDDSKQELYLSSATKDGDYHRKEAEAALSAVLLPTIPTTTALLLVVSK